MQATREGLTSQVGVMTSRLERLLQERTELDARQEQLTGQLAAAGDDDGLKSRLQLALDELDYERRARNIEREQLAAMASQFNHVQEQLTQEQERFIASLNSLAEKETGAEINFDDLDLNFDPVDVFVVDESVEPTESQAADRANEEDVWQQDEAEPAELPADSVVVFTLLFGGSNCGNFFVSGFIFQKLPQRFKSRFRKFSVRIFWTPNRSTVKD